MKSRHRPPRCRSWASGITGSRPSRRAAAEAARLPVRCSIRFCSGKGRVPLNDNGRGQGRDPSERFAYELQDSRGRERRDRPVRQRRDRDPDDPGPDAPVRTSACPAGRRQIPRRFYGPERIRPEDGGPRYPHLLQARPSHPKRRPKALHPAKRAKSSGTRQFL